VQANQLSAVSQPQSTYSCTCIVHSGSLLLHASCARRSVMLCGWWLVMAMANGEVHAWLALAHWRMVRL
jgi:hypothetical protein